MSKKSLSKNHFLNEGEISPRGCDFPSSEVFA